MRLVQLKAPTGQTRVAIVEEDRLRLLDGSESVYDLAQAALDLKKPLREVAQNAASCETLEYDPIYRPGTVTVERGGTVLWSKVIASGETKMSHTLANLEHHHFKYDAHRRPGDAHIHFFGADAFSFGAGVQLQNGDVMEIAFEGCGRPLRNPVCVLRGDEKLIEVLPV